MQFLSSLWQQWGGKPQDASKEALPPSHVVVLVPSSTPDVECEQSVASILAPTKAGEFRNEPTGYKQYLYYYHSPLGYARFAQNYELSLTDRRLPRLVSIFNSDIGALQISRETAALASPSVTVAEVERGVQRYNERLVEDARHQPVDWIAGEGVLPHVPDYRGFEPRASEDVTDALLWIDEYGVFAWYSKPTTQGIWRVYSYRGPLPDALPLRPLPTIGLVTLDGVWHRPGGRASFILALCQVDLTAAWTKEVDRLVGESPMRTRRVAIQIEKMEPV